MKKITYYLSIGLLAYTGIVLADACDDLEIKLGKAKADVNRIIHLTMALRGKNYKRAIPPLLLNCWKIKVIKRQLKPD